MTDTDQLKKKIVKLYNPETKMKLLQFRVVAGVRSKEITRESKKRVCHGTARDRFRTI